MRQKYIDALHKVTKRYEEMSSSDLLKQLETPKERRYVDFIKNLILQKKGKIKW